MSTRPFAVSSSVDEDKDGSVRSASREVVITSHHAHGLQADSASAARPNRKESHARTPDRPGHAGVLPHESPHLVRPLLELFIPLGRSTTARDLLGDSIVQNGNVALDEQVIRIFASPVLAIIELSPHHHHDLEPW